MTTSAADRFLGGGGRGEEQLLHQPQMYYHVAQHSPREKLRFPPEEPNSFLLLHDPNAAQQLSAADSLKAAFVPASSSASTSTSTYYPHNPALNYGVLPIPAQQPYHQISNQGFSLSLSSSSSSSLRLPASRHHIASRPAPVVPFTGYAAVLSRSRFLGPARKLLEGACHVGQQAAGGGSSGNGGGGQEFLLGADPPGESLVDNGLADHGMDDDRPIFGMDQQWKKTRLVSMLDEVFRRYKQYYHPMHAVITSFESVAGLSAAAPCASMALKAMSKHFRCLKNMISDQLRRSNNGVGDVGIGIGREDDSSFGLLNSNGCLGRTINSNGTFAQPHVWRPQRGLPERAVSVLRAWLLEPFFFRNGEEYPTDMDKQNLAKQTGLTRNQVSNWFINARVRLWKPMVEEVHSLEMHQKHQPSAGREQPRPHSSSKVSMFGGASNHERVSLTLGLEECGDAYFGKDVGSRLLQDFVG
ncbi:unnamed protein product [Musa acuminata var. zebrina]